MESLPIRPQPARPFSESLKAWLLWFGLARVLVCTVAIFAVGAGGFWLLKAPPTAVESSLPYASSSKAPGGSLPSTIVVATASTLANEPALTVIVVHVAGAVVAPGVYELAPSSRIHQAIAAAGGVAADADTDSLNLATTLHDGDRIFVPRLGQAAPAVVAPTGAASGASGDATPGEPIDLNRATAGELDALPGVGPSTAAAIVAYRDQHGPFGKVEDLLNVRGIGPAKLDAMKPMVKV